MSGWIGVDLDGTLAKYGSWEGIGHIGDPIPEMVLRVKQWLSDGIQVKIFTARVSAHEIPDIFNPEIKLDAVGPIQEWCRKHIGQVLEITNVKDFGMVELWDDRAVQVETNTGKKNNMTAKIQALTIKYGDKELVLTQDEARALHRELDTIFSYRNPIPLIPYIISTPHLEPYRPWATWGGGMASIGGTEYLRMSDQTQ